MFKSKHNLKIDFEYENLSNNVFLVGGVIQQIERDG